jgi:hypothetical protein
MHFLLDRDADCLGQARGFFQARGRVATCALPQFGQSDDRAGTAREIGGIVAVENAQPITPRPGPRRN